MKRGLGGKRADRNDDCQEMAHAVHGDLEVDAMAR